MNQPIEPNDDSLSEALANLELQLKQHRPRAPRLDAAIFETAKSIVPACSESPSEKGSDPLEAAEFHEFFVVAGEGQTPFRMGSRLVAVIAASWIFGAVIGGCGTFFSMSLTNPGLSQSGVEIHKGANQPMPDESLPKTESPRPPQRTHEVAIGPIQEALNIEQLLGNEDEPLHVLTRFNSHKPRTVRDLNPSTDKTSEPIDFREINAITETFSPTSPVTRAELMQQYLESSATKIY